MPLLRKQERQKHCACQKRKDNLPSIWKEIGFLQTCRPEEKCNRQGEAGDSDKDAAFCKQWTSVAIEKKTAQNHVSQSERGTCAVLCREGQEHWAQEPRREWH